MITIATMILLEAVLIASVITNIQPLADWLKARHVTRCSVGMHKNATLRATLKQIVTPSFREYF